MNLICIKCPRGCLLNVEKDVVTGNLCPRGIDYAKEELSCPMRIVTSLARVGKLIVPVKTNVEVPKDMINQVLDEISKLNLKKTSIGQVVIKNVCGTKANVVVTGEPYISN